MTAITFDTLKYVKTLKAVGVDEKQAEAHAEAMREVQDNQLKELATKGDLRELKLEMTADMAKIHGELSTLRWGMAVTVGGIVALILKTFFPH
ncbi:MAG: DUF1640 domain-containing protein [Magnetococcales bacterium]|nr:DUF1640 domain-containing protein [Magnetococcales bacterium]